MHFCFRLNSVWPQHNILFLRRSILYIVMRYWCSQQCTTYRAVHRSNSTACCHCVLYIAPPSYAGTAAASVLRWCCSCCCAAVLLFVVFRYLMGFHLIGVCTRGMGAMVITKKVTATSYWLHVITFTPLYTLLLAGSSWAPRKKTT